MSGEISGQTKRSPAPAHNNVEPVLMKRLLLVLMAMLALSGCSPVVSPSNTPLPVIQLRDDYPKGAECQKGSDVDLRLRGIYGLDEDVVFVCGGFGIETGARSVLLRSEDGGQHWREVMLPALGGEVIKLSFRGGGQGWALLLWTSPMLGGGRLYRTTDYGRSWYKLSDIPTLSKSDCPVDMEFLDDQHARVKVCISKDSCYTLASSDGGNSWPETSECSGLELCQGAFEVTETVGLDDTRWRMIDARGRDIIEILRFTPSKGSWTTTGAVPKRFRCVNREMLVP